MTKKTVFATARTLCAVSLLAAGMVSLSACNTTRGAGQDVSAIGHTTSNVAASAQRGIANATGTSTN